MKKTKRYVGLIIFIILLISTNVFAVNSWDNKENKRREELFQETLSSYLEQYMKEETSEEKKIIKYEMNGYGISKETDDILAVSIEFIVEPYSKENTIWTNNTDDVNNGSYICFAKYKKENGDYKLERISEIPEDYEEFLEEFEKYKANLLEETSSQTMQGKETDNCLANQEIEKISNIVFIGSGIILALTMFIITLTGIKKLKHKR